MPSLEEPRTCDKSREKEKLSPCQNFINNLDQPSPTSILDATFEDDMNENLCQLSEANAGQQRKFSLASMKTLEISFC